MKLGWLVWYDDESKAAGDKPEFWITEPNSWQTYILIAYAEIVST